MGRGRGGPPKPPGEALEVLTIRVSSGTREFYEKFAALFHTDEITPSLMMRAVLDRFRHDVESEAEDKWLMNLNEQLSGRSK